MAVHLRSFPSSSFVYLQLTRHQQRSSSRESEAVKYKNKKFMSLYAEKLIGGKPWVGLLRLNEECIQQQRDEEDVVVRGDLPGDVGGVRLMLTPHVPFCPATLERNKNKRDALL